MLKTILKTRPSSGAILEKSLSDGRLLVKMAIPPNVELYKTGESSKM